MIKCENRIDFILWNLIPNFFHPGKIDTGDWEKLIVPEDLRYKAIYGTILEGMIYATDAFLSSRKIGAFLMGTKKDCKVDLELSVYKNRKE